MPLASWRTGTTAQAAHGCKSTARPAGRGPLFVTPGKQPDACPSRCRAFHGERSAQGVCLFLRRPCHGAHFIGPWLVVDVWFVTRGAAREPRGIGRFVGVWECFT